MPEARENLDLGDEAEKVERERETVTICGARSLSWGRWYHRIDLGNGVSTPGDRNQSLVFAMYEEFLPPMAGLRVLDLGSNAGGLSIEFAKRGAHVTAIELGATYVAQAEFISDRFEMLHGWEPTELLFASMIAHAGFRNVRHVSSAPRPGESKGNICRNRSYFFADAADQPTRLPFVDGGFIGKAELTRRR